MRKHGTNRPSIAAILAISALLVTSLVGSAFAGKSGSKSESASAAWLVDGAATTLAKRLIQARRHVELALAGARQQSQHRRGVDLQRPTHGRGQRAGKGRIGQLIEAVGLQRLQLGLRHLEPRALIVEPSRKPLADNLSFG